jgi:hypothetical protein
MIVEGKVRHRGELALAEHVNRAVLQKRAVASFCQVRKAQAQ